MSGHAMDFPPVSYADYEPVEEPRGRTIVIGSDDSESSGEAAAVANELAGPGGRVVTVHAANHHDAAAAIADVARSCSADRIVLGWDEVTPGRVLTEVVAAGICPVMVVPPCATEQPSG